MLLMPQSMSERLSGRCRDIKPENIFLSASHKFKMGDLGLAICAAQELPFTRSGTLDYMAPEVCLAMLFNSSIN